MKTQMQEGVLDDVLKGHTVFTIMTGGGDDRLTWDSSKPQEIIEAMEKFDEYMNNNYIDFLK